MPMQPSPMAETSRLLFPSLRFFILNPFLLLNVEANLAHKNMDGHEFFDVGGDSPLRYIVVPMGGNIEKRLLGECQSSCVQRVFC